MLPVLLGLQARTGRAAAAAASPAAAHCCYQLRRSLPAAAVQQPALSPLGAFPCAAVAVMAVGAAPAARCRGGGPGKSHQQSTQHQQVCWQHPWPPHPASAVCLQVCCRWLHRHRALKAAAVCCQAALQVVAAAAAAAAVPHALQALLP
ncbi:hypothetical protein COO60DRAFT_1523976 [Scenedesmus sp. NREL 46B-D3]|nr:hypothetical protein COO60DRAFT_1523976 [Scenedesmus sp. NREL 46B-D3]